jgi:hypothetical protein
MFMHECRWKGGHAFRLRSSSYGETSRLARPYGIFRRSYVAAGFFFGFGLAALGCATGSGPRSIDDRRPAVKV